MASRKRSHDDDYDGPTTSKKRILSSSQGTPLPNGAGEDEEVAQDDNLELFRKEAIYRKMKHYSRELDRSQSRVEQLELKRNTCEAGLAAISACWSQLIDAITSIAKSDDLLPPHERVQEAFDISAYVHDTPPDSIKSLLDKRKNATQALIRRFLQLGQDQRSLLNDPAYLDFQTTQTECAALRSRVNNLQLQLQDCKSERDTYHEQLMVAENRYERLKSKSVRDSDRNYSVETTSVEPDASKGESSRNTSPPVQSTGQANGASDGGHDWKEVARMRQSDLDKALEEIKHLHVSLTVLSTSVQNPPLNIVQQHPNYIFMLEKISHLNHNVQEYEARLQATREELYHAEKTRDSLQEVFKVEYSQRVTELQAAVFRKDGDIARLREIRDQQQAELNERRQKDSVKVTSVEEFKKLAHSRGEFISVLQDRLRVCKSQLAAAAGDADLMAFFFSDQTDASYVEDLKQRLTIAQGELDSYKKATSTYAGDQKATFEGHREALERLAEAEAELAKYRSIYGSSSMSSESSTLSDQLRRKEEEIRRLRLELVQREEAEKSLYTELDKVSAAWESLEQQLKTKVYDLSNMEERVTKSSVERAKSENKYYQVMREKEALQIEHQKLQRVHVTNDKLAIDKQVDKKPATPQDIIKGEQDTEKKAILKAVEILEAKIQEMDGSCVEAHAKANAEANHRRAVQVELDRVVNSLETEKLIARKAVQSMHEAQKEAEKMDQKAKAASTSTKTTKPSDLQAQLDDTMAVLKCSTCKINMRSTILSKCLHTFCKDCIEKRISTRQRKCPSCNLPFTQGEVMQMYFQ